MDRAASSAQGSAQGDPSTQRRTGPYPQPKPAKESGATLIAGQALVQTVRHFFPDLNDWLGRLPDSRAPELCTYQTRFLAWWGICLYLLQLGSRRQLDFELRDGGEPVLANLNRLAQTCQTSLPVHGTLDHFLGHVPLTGWESLRFKMVQRLLRFRPTGETPLVVRGDLQGRPHAGLVAGIPGAVAGLSGEYLAADLGRRRVQEFRWVPQLDYEDSEGRTWKLNGLECTETTPDGGQQYFAWLTRLAGHGQNGRRDRPERRTASLEDRE